MGEVGYGQFCPVAKASEVFATRWTPLIIRELLSGPQTFSDLQGGMPLISRAVLADRLRGLQGGGLVVKRQRSGGSGHDYVLTSAGEGLRGVIELLGQWGLAYTRDRLDETDLDPALLMWGLRKRALGSRLGDARANLRFEFSGVPASRTNFRVMWLLIKGPDVEVCVNEPGRTVDVTLWGDIRDWVDAFLGHRPWRELAGTRLHYEGERRLVNMLAVWLGGAPKNGGAPTSTG